MSYATMHLVKATYILVLLTSLTFNRALSLPPGGFLDNSQENKQQETEIAPESPFFDVNGTNIPLEKLTACHLRESRIFADWTQTLNPHPFQNIISPDRQFCSDPDLFLVVYVHTSLNQIKRRETIRRTWGNPDSYDKKIRVLFVVGQSNKKAQRKALLLEANTYGDVLQSDFFDSYRNLTYKAVSGLKWVTSHCQQAAFVLKTDDDVFVNMFALIKHLKYKLSLNQYRENLLMCNMMWGEEVMREAKWRVTMDECASSHWPSFCQGVAFVMTMDVARGLYLASYHVPYLWLDDVYVTGFLPLALEGQVQHVEMNHRYLSANHILYDNLLAYFTQKGWFRGLFYHVNDLNASQAAWKALLRNMQEFKSYQRYSNNSTLYLRNSNVTVAEEY